MNGINTKKAPGRKTSLRNRGLARYTLFAVMELIRSPLPRRPQTECFRKPLCSLLCFFKEYIDSSRFALRMTLLVYKNRVGRGVGAGRKPRCKAMERKAEPRNTVARGLILMLNAGIRKKGVPSE